VSVSTEKSQFGILVDNACLRGQSNFCYQMKMHRRTHLRAYVQTNYSHLPNNDTNDEQLLLCYCRIGEVLSSNPKNPLTTVCYNQARCNSQCGYSCPRGYSALPYTLHTMIARDTQQAQNMLIRKRAVVKTSQENFRLEKSAHFLKVSTPRAMF